MFTFSSWPNSKGFESPAILKGKPFFHNSGTALDLGFSNLQTLSTSCDRCFPKWSADAKDYYVDLFEFSHFNGIPWPLAPGVSKPRRWFADLRYTISTPLPHNYPSVRKEVLESSRVSVAVKNFRDQNPSLSCHSLNKKVCQYFMEIRATLSRFICKVCAYVLFKTFKRLMTNLYVSPQQMKRVIEANKSGLPLVYLPLHRSHLDYLLITWNAWHFGLPLPHIASGDNLNLSGFGWLLRSTGAFFIRRPKGPADEGGKDVLYRAVLHSYLEQVMKKGLPIEFFSEGTRSRFGKSLLPKHGLISNVVDAVQEGTIKDCYLVPVSYTYDQVAEGVFLNELMGIPKVRESVIAVFRGVFKAIGLSKRCGAVRMHYGQPVLLSHYLKALSASLENAVPSVSLTRMRHSYSYRELIPWHNKHEEKVDNRTLIRAIGFHVVYEAQMMNSISPVSVLSSLLLCKFRKGVSSPTLYADILWLCSMIIHEGSDIVGYCQGATSGKSVVEYTEQYLRDSVEFSESEVKPILTHREVIHLAYSKNALVPVFGITSAIALAIVSASTLSLDQETIVSRTLEICNFLQFEVIFCRPCQSLTECIREKLSSLISKFRLLEVAENISDDSSITYQTPDEDSRNILCFFSNFLRPFLQSFYLVCRKLENEKKPIREQDFVRNLCRESLHQNEDDSFTPLLEAINSDSFKNTLNTLRELSVLEKGMLIEVSQLGHLEELTKRSYDLLKVY